MLLNQKINFTDVSKMKLAIVSDTHEQLAPEVVEAIKDCDVALHAGDIGNSEVLKAMQPKTGHVIAVAGNNDKPYLWDFKDWNLVSNLPQQLHLHMPGGMIAIEHGHEHDMYKPSHDDLRGAHPQSRLVVYGHTHIQVIDKDNPQCHVLNPGAAGYTRNKGGPSFIVVSIDNDQWDYEVFKFLEEEKNTQ